MTLEMLAIALLVVLVAALWRAASLHQRRSRFEAERLDRWVRNYDRICGRGGRHA
jgi:hypothetical protein